MVHVLKKVERLGNRPVLANELDAEFAWIFRMVKLFDQAESLQGKVAERHERFPDVVAWELFFFHDQYVVRLFGQ